MLQAKAHVLDPCTVGRAELNELSRLCPISYGGKLFPARWHTWFCKETLAPVASVRLGNGDKILLLAIQWLTVGLLKLHPYLLHKDQVHVKDWLCKVNNLRENQTQHMKLHHCSYIYNPIYTVTHS